MQSQAVAPSGNYIGGFLVSEHDQNPNGGSNTPNKTSYFGFRKSSTNIENNEMEKQNSRYSNNSNVYTPEQ